MYPCLRAAAVTGASTTRLGRIAVPINDRQCSDEPGDPAEPQSATPSPRRARVSLMRDDGIIPEVPWSPNTQTPDQVAVAIWQ